MNSIQKCWCEKYNKEKHYCEYRKCQTVVDRVAGFNLPIWKNTSFVSQNSIYHNYFTLLKNAKPYRESCDEGYKPCGLLDSFNQTLCLLENETCPLNQIELSNSSTPSDIFTNKSAVNTTLLNDNITYLHTSNAEINSHIIIEVVLGPKSFCFYFNRRKLGPPDYWYEISSTSGKCTNYFGYEIDYNYISLDKYSKFNVYNENEIISKIQNFVDYSEEPYPLEELKNYNLHLYKHNYIGFNLTCLGEQELKEESFNFVKKHEDTIYRLNVSAAVFVFLQSVIFLLISRKTLKGYGDEGFDYFCIYVGGHVFTLIVIPLLSVSFALSLTSVNSIFKCAGSPMAEKLIDSEKLDIILEIVIFGVYMLMIAIKLGVLFIILCYWIICLCCKKISECCDNISDYCEKQKKKRKLAKLGFIEEDPQPELIAV